MDLSNTSAIVSGGAGGLGEATVRRLVSDGVRTVIADLADDQGSALAAELGPMAAYARTDITDESQTLAAVEVARSLGDLRVTVAAHGAGAAVGRVVGRNGVPLDLEGFRRTVDIYLTGTFNLLRLGAAEMATLDPLDDGVRGVAINTASIAAYEGQVGQTAYAAAKAGVVGLTLASARDLSPMGVRVMTIAPGTFFTPAFGMTEADAQQRWGAGVPFPKRMGHADEYAALVSHIVANDYLNGEVVRLDGAQRFGLK